MAGETSAELTIVVRAQDAATRVINSIGKTIGKVLLAPLTAVGKSVAGIFKQFFSLKALLVGGGIIGVIRSVVDGLSTSQTKFREVFSSATQRGINAVDDAFSRLGASIRATFGNLVGDGAGGIVGFLDSISDWLRDNQDGIRQFFKDLVDSFREIAALARSLAGGRLGLGSLLFGDSKDVKEALQIQKELDLATARFEAQAKRVFAGKFGGGGIERLNAISETGSPVQVEAVGASIEAFNRVMKDDLSKNFNNPITKARENAKALASAYNTAAGALISFASATDKVPEIVSSVDFTGIAEGLGKTAENAKKAATEVGKLTPIIEGYLEVGEFADLTAGTITDSFENVIRGTEKVGQAFANMVGTIIGELGRLLLYRSLLSLITSAFQVGNSLTGLGGLDSIPGSTSSGALTPDFDYPQLAQGTPILQSSAPSSPVASFSGSSGSNAPPSYQSGGRGDTINVYGARDARATAKEVAAEMRRNRVLRRSLA